MKPPTTRLGVTNTSETFPPLFSLPARLQGKTGHEKILPAADRAMGGRLLTSAKFTGPKDLEEGRSFGPQRGSSNFGSVDTVGGPRLFAAAKDPFLTPEKVRVPFPTSPGPPLRGATPPPPGDVESVGGRGGGSQVTARPQHLSDGFPPKTTPTFLPCS